MEIHLVDDLGGQWLVMEGRIDSLSSPEIRQKIESLILKGQRTIVIDLEKVVYMSSAGLRVVMESQMKLKNVGGEIILYRPTPNLVDLLRMSSFDRVFHIPVNREELEHHINTEAVSAEIETREIGGVSFQYLTYPSAAAGKLFAIGSQQKLADSSYTEDDAITVAANRIQFGTGLASLGGSFEECKEFFGEAMIVNRNFYFYPAVKRPAVDFMLCPQDESNIQYQFLHGFGFNGAYSHLISFECLKGSFDLIRMVESIFQIVEMNRIGVVFLAESKGFWGMHLRQVPIQANRPTNGKPIFDNENFSQWINFPIEAGEQNHIIAGVGIAVRKAENESPEICELLGKEKNFHIHAGVFAKEPLAKRPERFDEELKRVLTGLEITKVQHVLGHSKFGNGLIGIIKLED